MTRITVADTVLKAGEPWAHTPVRIELCDSTGTAVAPAYVTATGVIVEPFTTTTDADGIFTVQLDPTDQISPTGCFYGFTIGDVGPIVIRGDQGDGSLRSLRATTPTVLGSTATLSGLSDVDLTGRVDGSVVEWDTATSKWVMGTGGGGGGGGGAPTSAQYVTLAVDGTLSAERVLTAGSGITITDGGAGSTVTVAVTANTFQPVDSDLTAIAALSTTSFGRGLLALADAAALRTSAGLVIGTDIYSKAAVDSGFQPLDSDLTAIAALTTTTFGRSLLALADAAAARTALGLGGAAVLNVGTTTGTVAAGDDSRITGAAQKASNLSDLANAATARTNLGLGSAATQASSAFDAAGAAAAAQAYAIARANHTGTQTASTISDFDTQVATTAILKSLVDAKGDTLVGTADNTITRVAVGSNGKVQKADSTQTTGTLWDYAVPVHGAPKNGSTTYYTIPGFSIINTNTSALAPGVVLYFPIYAATPITVDQLAIEQTDAAAAGKLMRFGIIAADKWWQPTGSALADSGNIAADGANGAKTYTPGSPLSLAGRYVGVVHSDGAPTLRAWQVAGPGVGLPTAFGANVVSYWRATKALGAIDATAWDTVTTSVSAMQHLIALRVSEPAA